MDWPRIDDLLGSSEKGILIHHWDADGISSASLLKTHLESRGREVRLFTPVLGNFFLSDADKGIVQGEHDFCIVADIAIPPHDLLYLADRWPTIHVDHHIQPVQDYITQINPIIAGEDPGMWPSASWITTKFLNMPNCLPTAYGAVGDYEHRIVNLPTYPEVEAILGRYDLSLEDAMSIVELLDSSYKVGDRDGVTGAVSILRGAHEDPEALIEHGKWIDNLGSIEKEKERILGLPREKEEGITVLRFDTRFNLISAIGRKLAVDEGAAFMINKGFFDDRTQLYLRRADGVAVTDIIDWAKGQGFSAGGKTDVVGIVIPHEDAESVIDTVLGMANSGGN